MSDNIVDILYRPSVSLSVTGNNMVGDHMEQGYDLHNSYSLYYDIAFFV